MLVFLEIDAGQTISVFYSNHIYKLHHYLEIGA